MKPTILAASALSVRLAALLLPALISCHDAPRENPFDPELTTPVELRVTQDASAGTATLTWTQYDGQEPFDRYLVLRNVARSTVVDTLGTLSPVTRRTSYLDTLAPDTDYVYRVSVVNTGGFESPSQEREASAFRVLPVVLLSVQVDAASGEAEVRWSRFEGARFQAYRVERRRVGEDEWQLIDGGRLARVDVTALVDADLLPDVPYVYRVVVEAAGQVLVSHSSPQQHLTLSAVRLIAVEPVVDGNLRIRWSRFAGPEFEAYSIQRVAGGETQSKELLRL